MQSWHILYAKSISDWIIDILKYHVPNEKGWTISIKKREKKERKEKGWIILILVTDHVLRASTAVELNF